MNVVIKDIKSAKIICWILPVFIIGLIAFQVYKAIDYRNYIPIKATIEDIYTVVDHNHNDRYQMVQYSFEWDGKQHSVDINDPFAFMKKIGEDKTIYVNPENPEIIKNDSYQNINLVIIIVLTFWEVAMLIGIKQYNKQYSVNENCLLSERADKYKG